MSGDPLREAHGRVEIAPLQFADLDRVEEIEKECYGLPWSRAMFAGELIKSSSICVGAFRLERVIGYLIVSLYVDDWHIMNLAVDPAWRRRGVAALLLDDFFARSEGGRERGYTLEVRRSNDAAIRLYEKFGFVARGIRRGYYVDDHEDALVMWRESPAGRAGGEE
ncbi:MAG: ribosomal protein S18-alanine N-acetyltransferase [Gaiellaceae bacterium]